MAIPSTPINFYTQQANRQVALSWDLTVGATSYVVNRSTDGVTFASIATPTDASYIDTAVTVSTKYWYQVASVNASGTSPFTTPQVIIPTPTAEMSLMQLRLAAQQRADRVGSNFVTLPEWNSYINQSMFELYDMLITAYEDYFMAPAVVLTTDGTTHTYPLPNGVNYSGAKPLYKLLGVDLAINNANNAYVTMNKFNFLDRNRYIYPNSSSSIYGVFNCQYRMLGTNIELIPTPSANQNIKLWYAPRLAEMVVDTDTTDISISGWIEYVIVRAAMLALAKEESDVSILAAQLQVLTKRIEEAAQNRDAGQPDRITDIRQNGSWNPYGNSGGFNGPSGGY